MFTNNLEKYKLRLSNIYQSLKNEILFTIFTYFGTATSIVSGVLLARHLGVNDRGNLAYYSSFILLACFFSSFNFSSGTARIIDQNLAISTEKNWVKFAKIIGIGYLLSATFACLVIFGDVIQNENEKNYLLFLLTATGLAAISSYFEGVWTYFGTLKFVSVSRFIGLFIPAFYSVMLVIYNKATIRNLLLSQLLVLICNAILIIIFLKHEQNIKLPDFNITFKSAIRGMPTYLIDYFSGWYITYSIMHLDGAFALGNFAIAISLTSAADSIFGASRVKYYKLLVHHNIMNFNELLIKLLRSTGPSLLLHIIFIPTAFLIPKIYGPDFYPARKIAIFLLLSRSISIIARTIVLYLSSIRKDRYTIYIYLSFLITFFISSSANAIKILGYYWTYPFLLASTTMLFSSLTLLYVSYLKIRNSNPVT